MLALVPYPAAMLVWIAISLLLYLAAVRVITGGWKATLAALAWPAVLWNMVVGQTGFLTAALLGAGIALVDRRPALAGICFGLLTYKPQFGLLIPVALIAGGRWRVIGWAALSTLVLCAVSIAVLGTSPWAAFLESASCINDAILTSGGTDFSKLQSVYGYVRLLGGSAETAWAAHAAFVLCSRFSSPGSGAPALPSISRRRPSPPRPSSPRPMLFIYDFVVLAIPLVFLGRTGFSNRELPVVIARRCLSGGVRLIISPPGLLAGLLVLGLVVGRVYVADHLGEREQTR